MGTKITPSEKSLAEALQADLAAAKTSGIGLKQVSTEFGRSYAWAAEMVRGQQPFPLAKMGVWVRLTGGVHLARWVADRAGFELVTRAEDDLETTLVRAVKESSDATQVASSAMLDGEINDAEIAAYEREMGEAIENFRRLERALKSRQKQSPARPTSLAEAEKLSKMG